MSSVLIVGGDQIDSIKQVLHHRGFDDIHHWSGRKVGDSHKVIPQHTDLIVLITDWINHSFTHRIKRSAAKRGLKVIYTGNGSVQLQTRLEKLGEAISVSCRKTIHTLFFTHLAYS